MGEESVVRQTFRSAQCFPPFQAPDCRNVLRVENHRAFTRYANYKARQQYVLTLGITSPSTGQESCYCSSDCLEGWPPNEAAGTVRALPLSNQRQDREEERGIGRGGESVCHRLPVAVALSSPIGSTCWMMTLTSAWHQSQC